MLAAQLGRRPTQYEYPAETRDGHESTDIFGLRYYGHPKLLLFNELCRTRSPRRTIDCHIF